MEGPFDGVVKMWRGVALLQNLRVRTRTLAVITRNKTDPEGIRETIGHQATPLTVQLLWLLVFSVQNQGGRTNTSSYNRTEDLSSELFPETLGHCKYMEMRVT